MATESKKKAAPKKTKAKTGTAGARPKKAKIEGKLSAIDAAAKVLGETGQPMTTKEMSDVMATKGYWKSPGGKTPHGTLYSAILREINAKGKDSRFTKTERGKFAAKKA
jgi:HB1, ASXL, restriction endonuclease HTH domain